MQALPTLYAGITFRSRLEADFAAELDALGIAWEYEPEGYQLSDGSWYAPDFWLPACRAWLETKGPHMERISKVEQFSRDLWKESGADGINDRRAPMVILAQRERGGDSELSPNAPIPTWLAIVHGRRASIILTSCPECGQSTFVYLWQDWCRTCGSEIADPINEFIIGEFRQYNYLTARRGMARVPRPNQQR